MHKRVTTLVSILLASIGISAQAQVSSEPDTPFKLATFATGGPDRVGILVDGRLLDIQDANSYEILHIEDVKLIE